MLNVALIVSEFGSAAEHLYADDITHGHIVIDSDAQVCVFVDIYYSPVVRCGLVILMTFISHH